jgi:hypothetical protein
MAQAIYTVTINDDSSITTVSQAAGEGVARQATTFDIYQSSKELVSEIDNQLLAERVAKLVLNGIRPTDPSAEIRAKIIDALSDRGIEPTQN